jgi:hypothetical protein
VKRRAESYRGRRMWTPESGDPFILLAVDELADVIAYQTDRNLRDHPCRAGHHRPGPRAGRVRAGAIAGPSEGDHRLPAPVLDRIAMRLDEPAQVDMVLGDGVRERGTAAHEIPESTPGGAWVKEDGKREPVRGAGLPRDSIIWPSSPPTSLAVLRSRRRQRRSSSRAATPRVGVQHDREPDVRSGCVSRSLSTS